MSRPLRRSLIIGSHPGDVEHAGESGLPSGYDLAVDLIDEDPKPRELEEEFGRLAMAFACAREPAISTFASGWRFFQKATRKQMPSNIVDNRAAMGVPKCRIVSASAARARETKLSY